MTLGQRSELLALLDAVAQGDVDPAAALRSSPACPSATSASPASTRPGARQGAPEAVLAEGKTPDEIEAIVRALRDGRRGLACSSRAPTPTRALPCAASTPERRGARARALRLDRRVAPPSPPAAS